MQQAGARRPGVPRGVPNAEEGSEDCGTQPILIVQDLQEGKPLIADGMYSSTATTVLQRIDRHVLPVFLTMATLCYLDRTNLAFASVELNDDLGFTPEVYGLGSGLFFVGYAVSMVPSQLLLMRVGTTRWLGTIVTLWGITAMCFAFISTTTHFYMLRLVLGVAESGAFPGMWYYLNSFYPPDCITRPYALIEAAVGVANVIGAPLAAGLLLLDGWGGMRGWQWLFLLEGIPSVALGLSMTALLPRDYSSASFLSNSEKAWLGEALATVKKHNAQGEASGAGRLLLDACSNPRLWVVAAIAVLKNAAMNGVLFWTPLLVNALLQGDEVELEAHAVAAKQPGGGAGGHHAVVHKGAGVQAVLLTAIPFVCASVCAVWLGHRSEKRREKVHHVAVPYVLAAALFLGFPFAAASGSVAAFLCLTAAVTTLTAPNAIVNAMAAAVGQGPAQALTLAVYNAVGNLGGLLGPWVVGWLVQRTGSYSASMQAMGLCVLIASGVTSYTKRWGLF